MIREEEKEGNGTISRIDQSQARMYLTRHKEMEKRNGKEN
jgi:hypothetical protein